MVGDYISRKAALNASKIVYIEYIEVDGDGYEDGNADEIPVVFKRDIEAIPAADVVEVRHASWIEDGYTMEPCVCSNCGEPCKDTVMGNPRWNYCPNCGAKMVSAL